MKNALILAIVISLGFGPVAAETSHKIADLSWLSGEWIGEGKAGDDGAVKGVARLYWTPAVEGAVSSTFTWHAPTDEHVHYAFTVFQQAGDGVVEGRGIHYGADFVTFEDAPWQFIARDLSDSLARFDCVANCRANSVTYRLLDNGQLEARWDPIVDDAHDWIVTYQRVSDKK